MSKDQKRVATKVKDTPAAHPGQVCAVYRVSPPMTYQKWDEDGTVTRTTEFVWVSGVNVPFSGVETYIFPSDAHGEVADWGELDGSFRGGIDHARALKNAGYDIE